MRSDIENHALARQDPCAAAIEADFDGLRCNEPAGAHDQLGPARLVIIEMHGDQAIDHLSLARQHLRHVDDGGTRHHPELVCMAHQIGDFGAPDLILAGQAVRVRAGTADQLALDNGGAMPRIGHIPSQVFASFTAAEDEHAIALRLGRHVCAASAESSLSRVIG